MLEGPDLAGKTTLAERIHKKIRGSEIHHQGPPPDGLTPFDIYLRPLQELYDQDVFAILDRWHWGEMIYGPIKRDVSRVDSIHLEYLELACMRYGVWKVLLVPNIETLHKRYDARGESFVSWPELQQVARSYIRLESDIDVNVHYVTDADEVSKASLSFTISRAMQYRDRARRLSAWPSYIGPATPRVVFVGEKPAESHVGEHPTAFVPYLATSGRHLIRSLRSVPICGYGLTNACTGENLYDLWIHLDRPRFVALGHKAHKQLNRFKVPHGWAPHPQYARRFHNKKITEYGAVLHQAAKGADVHRWKG